MSNAQNFAISFPFFFPASVFGWANKNIFLCFLYLYTSSVLPVLNMACLELWRKTIMTELVENQASCSTLAFDKLKKYISLLSQFLWLPNVAGWWLTGRESYLYCHVTLYLCDLARICDDVTHYVFNTKIPMATKRDRVLTYNKELS